MRVCMVMLLQVAMRKLTHHAGLQEVMGTPLAGGQAALVLLWLTGFCFRLQSRHC